MALSLLLSNHWKSRRVIASTLSTVMCELYRTVMEATTLMCELKRRVLEALADALVVLVVLVVLVACVLVVV